MDYSIKEGILIYNSLLYWIIAILRTSGLQVCMHPLKGKRKESAMRDKDREGGAPKINEGSVKTTNSYSPSKVDRSGVTFH